jgi:hypothetical protein
MQRKLPKAVGSKQRWTLAQCRLTFQNRVVVLLSGRYPLFPCKRHVRNLSAVDRRYDLRTMPMREFS